MALKTIQKINLKLEFLYRKTLTPELRQLLCNAITQPHFDYGFNTKTKKKLQIIHNKCIHLCLQLDLMSTISHK